MARVAPASACLARHIAPFVLLSSLAPWAAAQAPGSAAPTAQRTAALPGYPPDEAAAARFLNRATFGATEASIQRLRQLGYAAWLDEQMALPASLQLPYVEAGYDPAPSAVYLNDSARREAWLQNVVLGQDQLRQKTAWALSQILVVSIQKMEVFDQPLGTAHYYDQLATQAFGSYRELLETVTLSPVMGEYLDILENAKTDPATGVRPDENYAREVLQLFSVGLVELELDGTPRLDAGGLPIAVYEQPVVEGFAKVFTGWAHAGKDEFAAAAPSDPYLRSIVPMELYPEQHDPDAKLLLGGVELPAGQPAVLDLELALDNIFEHPNVGPFLARLLIQRFTTSNPSPAYVERVARAFEDDGAGQRGSLGAVVRAVLLDPEAQLDPAALPPGQGRLREPLLRQVALWRTFDGRSANGLFAHATMFDTFGQAPLASPSVFNFYNSDHAPSGEFQVNDAAAPEFQITTHKRVADVTNRLMDLILKGYAGFPYAEPDAVLLQLEPLVALSSDPTALVERIDLLWSGGTLSEDLKAEVLSYVATIEIDEYAGIGVPAGMQRVVEALALIVSSPEGAVQR